jgi:hypothetical protein
LVGGKLKDALVVIDLKLIEGDIGHASFDGGYVNICGEIVFLHYELFIILHQVFLS